jgi:hypothetical protein
MANTNSQILRLRTRQQNWLIWTPHVVTQASYAIRSESALGVPLGIHDDAGCSTSRSTACLKVTQNGLSTHEWAPTWPAGLP